MALAIVLSHPHLDHRREIGALGADEHLQVDDLDVEVDLLTVRKLLVADEAAGSRRLAGHFDKTGFELKVKRFNND